MTTAIVALVIWALSILILYVFQSFRFRELEKSRLFWMGIANKYKIIVEEQTELRSHLDAKITMKMEELYKQKAEETNP